MKIVYIAAPLGSGEGRENNRAEAAKWVAYCADGGNAPIATWITLSGEWSEDRREQGLEIDKRLIEVCHEVWLCGPRISPGMLVEAQHALKCEKTVYWMKVLGSCERIWGPVGLDRAAAQ